MEDWGERQGYSLSGQTSVKGQKELHNIMAAHIPFPKLLFSQAGEQLQGLGAI